MPSIPAQPSCTDGFYRLGPTIVLCYAAAIAETWVHLVEIER